MTVRAMLDSGSMACTLSSCVMPRLLQQDVLKASTLEPTDIVLIGCGGSKTIPSGLCDLGVDAYGCKVIVPTLVVDDQSDDLIIGSNLMRYLAKRLKIERGLLNFSSVTTGDTSSSEKHLLSFMTETKDQTVDVADKVGTVKVKRAVTLEPMTEHLVWGKLQQVSASSIGSTVVLEPTSSRARPRSIVVGRTLAFLREDGWLPLKVINPSDKPVTVRRNAKLADVYSCVAVESFCGTEDACDSRSGVQQNVHLLTNKSASSHENHSLTTELSSLPDHPPPAKSSHTADTLHSVLDNLGLSDIDIDSLQREIGQPYS